MNIILRRSSGVLLMLWFLWCQVTKAAGGLDTSGSEHGIVDYELYRLEFRAGHPLAGESFEDAAKPPSADQLRLLEENALFLTGASPKLGAEVIGSTDSRECAELECRELSLRRAESVCKWLVEHGVAASRLIPKGDGADYPIGDNSTEEGRQYNRRVQFDLFAVRQ